MRRRGNGRAMIARCGQWLALCGGLLFWCARALGAPSVTAQIDRDTVALGETVTLSLVFTEAVPAGTPQLPPLANLRALGVSQSSEFNIVNGAATRKQTFNYTLAPTQVGEVVIPGMQVQVAGTVLATQPLKLRVVPAGQTAQAKEAFLRLIVPRSEVFVGEAFPVEVQLYFQNLQQAQMPQVKAEGFSLTQPGQPGKTGTQVGGVPFNLYVFKMAATAARPGTLTLGPAECNVTVLVPDPRGRRRDPFEFFGFGPPAQAKPLALTSEAIPIRVSALPTQDVPASFNGAVGSFRMTVTAGPTNVAVGDPITVKVQIAGRGLLDGLKLPDQPAWREFKTYSPTSQTFPEDSLGLSGAKAFEQVVIPQNDEVKSLPPLRFSYFDIDRKSYQTLSGPEIALLVRPSGVAQLPLPAVTNAESKAPPPADDIVHIKARLEPSAAVGGLLARQPWFLALQGVPLLAWVSLLVLRKRREALENNPRRVRQRLVAQRVRDGLKDLQAHAEERRPDEFFATLFRLLQEQLGERLDLPASAITEAVIDEKLAGRDVPQETLAALHDLFQTCNQARYAAVQTTQELSVLIPKLERVLAELKQMKG